MVDANLTYLDSLNRYIVLWSYKALTGLLEKRLVSTKPIKSSSLQLQFIEPTTIFNQKRRVIIMTPTSIHET